MMMKRRTPILKKPEERNQLLSTSTNSLELRTKDVLKLDSPTRSDAMQKQSERNNADSDRSLVPATDLDVGGVEKHFPRVDGLDESVRYLEQVADLKNARFQQAIRVEQRTRRTRK